MNTDTKLQKLIKLIKDKISFICISLIKDEEKKFNFIYKYKYWQNVNNGSLSGAGSNLDDSTHNLSIELPSFIDKHQIKSFLDIPCGDWEWMSKLNLNNVEYIGCDIVEDMIMANNKKYSNVKTSFIKKNLSMFAPFKPLRTSLEQLSKGPGKTKKNLIIRRFVISQDFPTTMDLNFSK